MSKARNLSDFISDPAIDSTELGDGSVTTAKLGDQAVTPAKLHNTLDLSSKTVTLATDGISGNSVHGGVISDFASTGIDDNATSNAVTILSSGNVGIGTDSPNTKLHVDGNGSAVELRVAQNGTYYTDIGINHIDVYNNDLRIMMGGSEKWRFKSGGDLYASGAQEVKSGDKSAIGYEAFFGANSLRFNRDGDSYIDTRGTNNNLKFRHNSNYDIAMTILGSNGNVGIGTTSPGEKLHVEGSIRASGNVGVTQADGDYLARLYQSSADGFLELYTGESTPVSRVKIAAYGNSYINPNGGGNVGIGTTAPSEELHIYDAVNDPYVLVDGSGANRDSGYKINAGNGVKIAIRSDTAGNMYFADNAISVTGSIGNSQYRTIIVDSEIQVGGRPGVTNSNPARAIVARMIEAQELSSGYAMLSGQGDTLSGYARRKNSGTGTNTFFFGPYGTFPAGQFTALFRLKISVVSSGGLGYIDVTGSGTTDPTGTNSRPRTLNLSTSSFSVDGQYQYFALDFDRTTNGGSIEFRWINANNNADCYIDHILILPRLNH